MAVSYSPLSTSEPGESPTPRKTGAMAPQNRRYVISLFVISALAVIVFIGFFRNYRPDDTFEATIGVDLLNPVEVVPDASANGVSFDHALLAGPAIAPKLGNETVKAELGRAAWKLFHTTLARFPEQPTPEQSESLRAYLYLFQRLYPCGECAEHFARIIRKFPPQVSSRNNAAAWGCHVHNEVNKTLKKDLFDCANIGDFYDCGCADDDAEKASA